MLDEIEYNLCVNNGPNTLHGGTVGFDKVNETILNEITADLNNENFIFIRDC